MKSASGQKLKEQLNIIFAAPPPCHKTEFLQKVSPMPAKLSLFAFLQVQLCYIRKRIWIASALLFGALLFGSFVLSADMIWAISAFAPLLALFMVTETGRSETWGMAELEMATRFSLRSVLLARLGILGLGSLFFLGLSFLIGLSHSRISPPRAALFIITPFLLTTFSCLQIVRRRRERESIYLCAGVSSGISLLTLSFHLSIPGLYGETPLICFLFAAVLSGAGTAKQYHNLIRQEELTWNLS